MDQHGFIHEKLDIKLLILYILSRLPAAVDRGTLDELCQKCDNGVGYFDYSDCLGELMESGHITAEDEEYTITEKGRSNAATVESSLPYSVRSKAQKLLTPVAERLARAAMIGAQTFHEPDGSCKVHLTLSDGVGEIFNLTLLCSGEEQAKAIKKHYRRNAEELYQRFIALLSEE